MRRLLSLFQCVWRSIWLQRLRCTASIIAGLGRARLRHWLSSVPGGCLGPCDSCAWTSGGLCRRSRVARGCWGMSRHWRRVSCGAAGRLHPDCPDARLLSSWLGQAARGKLCRAAGALAVCEGCAGHAPHIANCAVQGSTVWVLGVGGQAPWRACCTSGSSLHA